MRRGEMGVKTLDAVLSDYRETLGPGSPEDREMARFRGFLLMHGGPRKMEVPGRDAHILEPADFLRCFHFSQYLDWYLAEREGVPTAEVEGARAAMNHFNEWLLERGIIGVGDFEENRESILGGEEGPPVFQELGAGEESTSHSAGVAEERDFYVPGEYASVVGGEFVITKVQEGILYGKRDGDPREIGPILVDRAVSGGSKVGDRVHLSLGKAGSHWNLLTMGRRKS
jgi:hypothetical protein